MSELSEQTTLECGDLVQHKIFGFGKIIDIAWNGAEVMFDSHGTKRIAFSFLDLVEPGTEKGVQFWHKEWTHLSQQWVKAREAVNQKLPTIFRPKSEDPRQILHQFTLLREREAELTQKIEAFLKNEKLNLHK